MNIICTHMHCSGTNQDTAHTHVHVLHTQRHSVPAYQLTYLQYSHIHTLSLFRCLSLLSALQQAAVFMNLSHYFSTVCLTQEVKTQAVLTSANT